MTHNAPLLLHYSEKPIEKLKKKKQCSAWKPTGLWYSIGTAWKDWGVAESFEIRDKYVYKLTVDYSTILKISSEEEIDQFTRIYGVKAPYMQDETCSEYHSFINWDKIADQYFGIEISPYLQSRRLNLMWYYVWDVPSGCIWNPGAIQEFHLFKNG